MPWSLSNLAMPHLSLSLLGGFTATLDGAPLTAFGTDKVRALLAYLSVESARPHARAALAEMLWPDSPAQRGAHNLRQHLLLLRRALSEETARPDPGRPALLLLTRQNVQLNPLGDVWLDVAVFGELLRACQEHTHEQAATCRVCMGWLAQAAELYRGDFLAGFALRDSVPFDEWQLVQQETLHRQAVEILARLASYHADRGEHDLVQRYAGRLVALDPWHEQGLLQLMRALAHSGQGVAALEQYARYRESLARELALPPSAEVTALFQQIQARQLGGAASSLLATTRIIPAAPTVLQGERRQITALICSWRNAAGSDDPEDLEQYLAYYESWLQPLLDRYGGHGPQRQGDEWLIYFGYPQAYEDAARRAVHVGLALLAAARGNDRVRVAVHTDIMVVGAGEPVGDVPSVTRLCLSLAEPGTMLITAATERLVRGWFACCSLEIPLRTGTAQPTQVYQVLGEEAARSHLDWLAQIAHLTPLAGREHELAQLNALLEQTVQGRGTVVTVSGDPGIGKSRLVWELRQRWGTPALWIERRCSPYFQNTHLYPIIGLLEDLLGVAEDDSLEARSARLTSALAHYQIDQPGALWLLAMQLGLPTELPTPQTITAQQRERMREVTVSLLQRAAATRPLVLVIEDLHWADPSTVAWLGASLAALAAAPCLTLLTFRPAFQPPWPPSLRLSSLALAPLHTTDVAQMVADLTRASDLAPALRRHIIAQSDGVPLFVEELTQALGEGGAQAIAAIPTTLRDSLLARLERVGPARETAGWAAAIGREVAYPILAAVVPYDEPRLQADLIALTEAGLLISQRSGRDAGYAFKHALVQEAAHAALLRRTRQSYHRRIAECYAACFPQIAAAQPELLAQHYEEAGATTDAADHWLRAAKRALAQGAIQEASAFCERAERLIESDDDERRWRALAAREQVLDISGARELQQVAITALHTLADTLNDDGRRAYAYLRQTSYAGIVGDYHGVVGLADMASAAARRTGDLELELHALAYKAQTLAVLQEFEATLPVLETALAQIERLRDDSVRARILTAAAYYYLEMGDLVRAVQFQRQSLEAIERARNPQQMSQISANLGSLYTVIGRYADARRTLEQSLRQAVVIGEPRIEGGVINLLGVMHWYCGDLEQAQVLFEQALALLTEVGDTHGQALCHSHLGYVLEARGIAALAATHLAQAREHYTAIGMEYGNADNQAAEARAMLALGRMNEARRLAVEAWATLRDRGVAGISERSLACLCIADVFAALGDPALPPDEALAIGYRDLMRQAAQISDPEWRQSFLENVPANRALLERQQHAHHAHTSSGPM